MNLRFLPIVLLGMTAVVSAQVPDESYWTDSEGNVARVEVTDTPDPGVQVTVTDATGFAGAVTGVTGANSTPERATTSQTNSNSHTPGNAYRVIKNAKGKSSLYKKNSKGKFVAMKKAKQQKAKQAGGVAHFSAGFSAGAPGEEVTGLPH